MPVLLFTGLLSLTIPSSPSWGFYAHQLINRDAVFLLPAGMRPLYRRQLLYLAQSAVDPDRRRYVVENEAPCHYIDLEAYDSLPRTWLGAIALYGEDSLYAHGMVPWQVGRMRQRLTTAFRLHDGLRILKLSADLGHYIADAHVPLHTTRNYNGQLTGQTGIHAFWESRLPELFSEEYDLFTGKAEYLDDPVDTIFRVVLTSHRLVEEVLRCERQARKEAGEQGTGGFERRGARMSEVYSREYARRYQRLLKGMVADRLRCAIQCVADFWYTCWVDAGQPDLSRISLEPVSYATRKMQLDSLIRIDSARYEGRE